MTDTEVWVPIHNFPNYQVSTWGNVRNFLTKKNLRPHKHNKGYVKVQLRNNDGTSHVYIHRLVLIHFVNNPEGKQLSDHIDGDRTNNHVSNLRWATPQESAFNRVSSTDNDLPKGVYQAGNKFRSEIRVGDIRHNLGRFETAEDAGEAYRKKAEELQGGYAVSKSRTKKQPPTIPVLPEPISYDVSWTG